MKFSKIIFSFSYIVIFQYLIFWILLLGAALGEVFNIEKDSVLDFIVMLLFSVICVTFYILLIKKILGSWLFILPIVILFFLKLYNFFYIPFYGIALTNIFIGIFFILTTKKKPV